MGYLRPTAIIVTGSHDMYAEALNDATIAPATHWATHAHREAVTVFARHNLAQCVGEIIESGTNDVRSFLIAWDGSKEGWSISDAGDAARDEYIAWLRSVAYGDGSSPLDWVEIQYGGDDREAPVLRHGDDVGAVA